MKSNLNQELTENILGILKQAVPQGWEKLLLYGEVDDEQCFSFFYFFPDTTSKAVYSSSLIETGTDPDLLADLLDELDDCLISLWEETDDSPWTTLTLTIDSQGSIGTEYGNPDLQKGSLEARQKAWEKKYVGN